jgi:hypothetical protein
MQGANGDFSESSLIGKQPGRALRIAAGFHCAEVQKRDIVNPDLMLRSVSVSDYFVRTALYMQGAAVESPESKKLHKLLDWIISQEKVAVLLRDVHRGLHRQFGENINETRKYMHTLTELGHIRKYDGTKAETYLLHPGYLKRANLVTKYDM